MRRRWPAVADERTVLVVLALLLAVGIALRLTLMLAQSPALLGYDDTLVFLRSARDQLFGVPSSPVGYVAFLRAAHWVWGNLAFVVGVQHLLGVATALLLFSTVRRVAPAGWGLVPAAVVLLAGPQILLEHAVLSEALFAFLVAASCYCATRAVTGGSAAWGWAAGALAASAGCVRSLGLALAVLVVGCLVLGTRGGWRPRLAAGAAAAVAAWLVIAPYVVVTKREVGYVGPGLTRASGWALYARTAPFADCDRFTPPAGTAALCERRPPAKRPEARHYALFDSPAEKAFGPPPYARPRANRAMTAFARAAILHQPLDYLADVGADLGRYWSSEPRTSGATGESYDVFARHLATLPLTTAGFTAKWYSTPPQPGDEGLASGVREWEQRTRLEGPLLVLLTLLALLGLPLARGPRLAVQLLLVGTSLLLLVGSVASAFFDARYAVPGYGPLAASGALGGASLFEWVRARRRRGAREPASAAAVVVGMERGV
jgi:4-amino-4-deoxy-L-arabinose transferase-like glycosyltransferase